jgi:formyltetrahydrofolate deformylase
MSTKEPATAEEAAVDPQSAILRIEGPDTKGIVAAFAQVLFGHGCNVLDSEQHSDVTENRFFQRIKFDCTSMHTDRVSLEAGIQQVCERFSMNYKLNWGDSKYQMAIFVSKFDHVLWEVLLRHQAGELPCDIPLIISNHEDLRNVAEHFGIRYEVFKITKDTKREQEDKELALMRELKIDLVVLARYMQIISDEFCKQMPNVIVSFMTTNSSSF